jgi:sugar lactone lactonase YvrE
MKIRHFLAVLTGLGLAGAAGAMAQTYSISTLAGEPSVSGSGDGTNSNAHFSWPSAIAVNAAGEVFVGDTFNHTLRKLTLSGDDWVVTTIAGQAGQPGSGNGVNNQAHFQFPYGIAVDGAGNIYVAEANNDIRMVAPSGPNWVVTTVAGSTTRGTNNGVGSAAGFYSPNGVAVDTATNLYVADTGNHTIRKISRSGTNWAVTTIAGVPGEAGFNDGTNSSARFDTPCGIAVDGAGTIFVADGNGGNNQLIRKINASGTNWVVTTFAGAAGVSGTNDGPGASARFTLIGGLAVAKDGMLLMTDNQMIRMLVYAGSNSRVMTMAGQAGQSGTADGSGSSARFGDPWNLSATPDGNLYVADTSNQLIRKGTFSPAPLPPLQLSYAARQLVLSWPLYGVGYALESAGAISTGAAWARQPLQFGIVGNNYVLTNSLGLTNTFYRLHWP